MIDGDERRGPEAARRATPGSELYRHFNSAGCALPTLDTLTTVVEHLRLEASEGGYEAAAAAADRISSVYDGVARLVSALPSEIALFDSASTALRALVDAWAFVPGSHVVVARSSYVSHALHLMQLVRNHGLTLDIVDNASDGSIDLDKLDATLAGLDGAPTLLSVAHVPTSSGLVEPVSAIGRLARRHGATYLVDATQSVGQIPLDVDEIGCDALVGTGRKFLRGPRGTGFAYVRAASSDVFVSLVPDVRGSVWESEGHWSTSSAAIRFESWENSVACRLGLGTAIDSALSAGIENIGASLAQSADRTRTGLATIRGVRIQDPLAATSGIVTFSLDGVADRTVVSELRARDVRVTSVPATHGQWDLGARNTPGVVRASTHVYNSSADVDALLEGVQDIALMAGSGRLVG